MSPDVIGVILAMVGAVATIFGGMFVLFSRFETRIYAHMDFRFDGVDRRFDEVDRRFEDVDRRIAEVKEDISLVREDVRALTADVVDLKVSVARLEGPQPTLLRTRLD